MESANKAIIMAFGMLVAVMIMGTIVYVFTNLKIFPEEDASRETVEQITAFNIEYEVYDKKIMYGVDVISVLNKAKSNNDKYVQGRFLSGIGYNTDYIVDIQVELKTELQERIVVTYLEQTTNGVVERDYMEGQGPSKLAKEVFKAPSSAYRNLIYTAKDWEGASPFKLQSQVINTKVDDGIYHLLAGDHVDIIPGEYTNAMIENDSTLKSLLEQSAEMAQTEKNPSGNRMRVGTQNASGVFVVDEANTGWNKATWYPAIYDLKTRKFECIGEDTVYSERTGRIIHMSFREL